MAWYEKVLGLEDKEKNQEELDDMYNATGNSQKQVEQQGEEEKAESTKPARAERKRAGEDVSGEQHDHTDPFKQRVGVVPDDIANHDPNKGMENDKVDVTPAKTTEGTQNGDTYRTMEDIAKIFQTRADEEEKESQENEAELKRTAKRRMLLAGIADAANSFHQAYAYARGIKPMNENKGYAKEVRKELREDLDWLRKNKDRVLNYRAKAAEIGKAIESLKNKEALMEWRTARLQADIDKTNDKAALEWKKLEIDEAYKNGLLTIKQYELLDKLVRTKIAQQNADTSSKNAETNAIKAGGYTKEKTDEVGNKTIEISTPNVSNSNAGGTSGNSNAGTSNSSEDNTPPSKRPKGNNDSTPPSRRKK